MFVLNDTQEYTELWYITKLSTTFTAPLQKY